jgi:hypothetical protein
MDRDVILDPGTSRLVRTWLHETADELPDDPALFAAIKTSLRATRPRSRRWTWPVRPGTLRAITASLVATLAIVIAGLAVMPSPDGGAPAVGAAPSASPSPSPSPMPLPDGVVPAGRYSFPRDAVPLVGDYEVSLDVPAGWSNDNGGWVLTKGGDAPAGATVEVDIIERIRVDPCHSPDGWVNVPSDSTLEGFAAILTSWGSDDGVRPTTAPTTTDPVFGTFDGRPGVELTVMTPADVVEASCTDGHYTLWGDEIGGRYIQGPGESFRIRAIQVDSDLLFLAAGSYPGTPADVLAEQQAMLDSVRIVSRPARSSASASPTPAASLETLPNLSSDSAPGRYRVNPDWLALGDGYEVSLDLPAGWQPINGIISNGRVGTSRVPQADLDLFVIDKVVSDPCPHEGLMDGHPWYRLDWFAASLTTEWSPDSVSTNPVTTEPTFAEFDGYPGFELTAKIPMDLDLGACAGGEYHLWTYADGSSPRSALPGDELLIRVIAVEPLSHTDPRYLDPMRSGYLSIVATSRPGASAEARDQLRAMVDSIRITPAAPAASASSSPR